MPLTLLVSTELIPKGFIVDPSEIKLASEFPTFERRLSESQRQAQERWQSEFPLIAQRQYEYILFYLCIEYTKAIKDFDTHTTLEGRYVVMTSLNQAFTSLQRHIQYMQITFDDTHDDCGLGIIARYKYLAGTKEHVIHMSPYSFT